MSLKYEVGGAVKNAKDIQVEFNRKKLTHFDGTRKFLKIQLFFIIFALSSCVHINTRTVYEDTYQRTEKVSLDEMYKYNVDYSFTEDNYINTTKLLLTVMKIKICPQKEKKIYRRKESTIREISGDLYWKGGRKNALYGHGVRWVLGVAGIIAGSAEISKAAKLPSGKTISSEPEFKNGILYLSVGVASLITAIVDSFRAMDTSRDLGEIVKEDTLKNECGRFWVREIPVYLLFESSKIFIGNTDRRGKVEVLLNELGEDAEAYNEPWAKIVLGKRIVKNIVLPDEISSYLGFLESAKRFQTIAAYEDFISKYPNSKYSDEFKKKIIVKRQNDFEKVMLSQDPAEIEAFLSKYPESQYTSKVKARLRKFSKDVTIVFSSCTTGIFTSPWKKCTKKLLEKIYRIAKANTSLKRLKIIIKVDRKQLLDKYGYHPKENIRMGEIAVPAEVLAEVRKYKTNDDYKMDEFNIGMYGAEICMLSLSVGLKNFLKCQEALGY